ncbi:InlB B-repeat-containing protein [Peptoniphilus genitalis]
MNTGKSKTISFNLPTKDGDEVIVRTASRRDKNKFIPEFLYKKPTTDIKTDTAGLTFDTANKTVKSDKHKYKYDFNYDVINGGKLTMTEILPVTFDANGGKFANFTAPDTETKIVKEVEYDKNLTDKAEEPTKDGVSFKGWSTTQDGKTPVTDADFKNIKEAKTFYAIYDKASANISYLDLNGKSIDDKFKFDGAEYPKIEEGKAGTVVDKTKYTAETAPKFIGYKFNRVELNPKDAKYAFENQATIKIYYEKLDDIIQDKTPNDASDKPEGYVSYRSCLQE